VKVSRCHFPNFSLTGPVLFGLLFVAGLTVPAFAADTLRVVTHRDVTVVTDPSTGFRGYPAWGLFPGADTPVRRVVLRVKFGCPDSIRCADWDYLDHLIIRRKGGAAAPSLDYEIGRMLTPYGGAFGRDWSFEWTTDVTDFASLLRDSVEIEYYHSGYEPNADRGWRVTVEFDIITGPPVVSVLSVRKVHDGSYAYGDSARPIADSLAQVTFTVGDSADHVRFVVFQTGHGGDDSGCGEFCNKYREVLFDGAVVDKRQIWKRCGDNPLAPQAGTWIYDRANWCPGDLVEPDVYDFAVGPGSTHTIGLRMEPYLLNGTDAREAICSYLIQYRGPAAPNDAAIERVIVPSDDDEGRRLNPSCLGAVVVIRNLGAAPLKSLYIRYGTLGFDALSYIWEGDLSFNDTARIELPGGIPTRPGMNSFTVTLISPNEAEDAHPDDNEMSFPFHAVPSHLSPVVFYLRTNAEASQNSYILRSGDGDIVAARAPGSLRPDTTYADTFRLDPGCYELTVNDSAGDGLEFWYNVRGGRGTARLLDGKGAMLKNFESDFGSGVRYGFRVTTNRRLAAVPDAEPAIGLFPTRTLGVTTMDYFANVPAPVVVKIVADPGGEVVEERSLGDFRAGRVDFDLTSRGPQRYYLQVIVDGALKFNKRIRVVEKID
jgi:hypothetical protein